MARWLAIGRDAEAFRSAAMIVSFLRSVNSL